MILRDGDGRWESFCDVESNGLSSSITFRQVACLLKQLNALVGDQTSSVPVNYTSSWQSYVLRRSNMARGPLILVIQGDKIAIYAGQPCLITYVSVHSVAAIYLISSVLLIFCSFGRFGRLHAILFHTRKFHVALFENIT